LHLKEVKVYKFKNTNCTFCHKKLPKTKVQPSGEVEELSSDAVFSVGNCPGCGAPQRLVGEGNTSPDEPDDME